MWGAGIIEGLRCCSFRLAFLGLIGYEGDIGMRKDRVCDYGLTVPKSR